MVVEMKKTTRKARIRLNGKTYERRVYEFLDPKIGWWRDAVKLGGMSAENSESMCPLDSFDDYMVVEEATAMPGKWM